MEENKSISEMITTNNQKPISQLTQNPGLINPYIPLATSDNTRKAYRSDIRHYEQWGGKLPATLQMIADYLHFYADKLNPRTLARRLIAIKQWHSYQHMSDPTNHPAIQKTMMGILRTHGKPKTKAHAISPEELTSIHHDLKNRNTLSAIRDDALLQIGFFGALRRSELVAIQLEHITWKKEGLEILLPVSKTDQQREGQHCVIPYGNTLLCPIQALDSWINASGIKSGPIFRRISLGETLGNESLTPLSVNHILKNRAKAIGMDIKNLSSHSLRRGLATSAAYAGSPLHVIMRAGRWKQTNTVVEYIEASERFSENAAANVLKRLVDV